MELDRGTHVVRILEGHPFGYYPHSTMLNCSDRTKTDAFNAVKRLADQTPNANYLAVGDIYTCIAKGID